MAMSPRLLRPRATGGFIPSVLSGNVLWWDFSDQSAMGPTNTVVGAVSNNGPVGYVRDKSPAGNNAVAATNSDSLKPTFIASARNGLGGLSFDGGDFLQTAATTLMTPPFTLFIVALANATGTTRVCGVGSTRSIGPFAISNTQFGFFSAGGVQSFGVSATAASVMCMTANASSLGTFYGNGTQNATGTLAAMTPIGFALGADGFGSGGTFNGRVFEVVAYSRVLSDAERSTVTRWIGGKWGITVV